MICAMSGGVDSSAAAYILKNEGYDVIGVTMKLWDCFKAAKRQTCCSTADSVDAMRVCAQLGIPHHVVDMRGAFRKYVVEYFVKEYSKGRTPNPCIKCNEFLKFKFLREECAKLFSCNILATGHYARITSVSLRAPEGGVAIPSIQSDSGDCFADARNDMRFKLFKGIDHAKDQSYFLFTLIQDELARTIFPLGALKKEDVRRISKEAGLKTAEKRESQEICFIPDNDYSGFIHDHYPELARPAGDFVDLKGKVLGRHEGTHAYTIGQRRGLGFGFGFGKRKYVVGIDVTNNRVVLGDNEDLMKSEMTVEDVTWTSGCHCEALVEAIPRLMVKIRYRHEGAPARVEIMEGGRAKVVFDKPQRAVTPGQAAVFYAGDEVLGGGWILGSGLTS